MSARAPRQSDTPTSFDIEALIAGAVHHIVAHEDPRRLHTWMLGRVRESLPAWVEGQDALPLARRLATGLVFAVWNATPLPSHGLRPRPLPKPRRNEPCPCGSGRKYKRCCIAAPAMPALEGSAEIWMAVLDALDQDTGVRLAAEGAVPADMLAMYALELGQRRRSVRRAVKLLEALLAEPRARTSRRDAVAFEALVTLYDDLGYTRKKRRLVERVLEEARRCPLRARAWEWRAIERFGTGDVRGAWAAYEAAGRDGAEPSDLARLEVVLHVGAHDYDRARERARFWLRRLQRMGGAKSPVMEFLETAADDPLAAFGVGAGDDARAGQGLRGWLDAVTGRELPVYRIGEPVAVEGGLEEHLRRMGLPAELHEEARKRLEAVREAQGGEEEEQDEEPVAEAPPQCLVSPPGLAELEAKWREVFPLGKPFSVQDLPYGSDDAWARESEWVGFLHEHPEAWDSLEVLDDLATAVMQHPAYGRGVVADTLLGPVLARACAITEAALAGRSDARLEWAVVENRACLRSMVRRVVLYRDQGAHDDAVALAERVLALNPHDNHGLRAMVMDAYLRAGRDAAALALAERYPGDMDADVAYGRPLALFRIKRYRDAERALAEAVRRLPAVARYLTPRQVEKPPEARGEYMTVGGEAQAWDYRQSMRDVWALTPGALAWLEKSARRMC